MRQRFGYVCAGLCALLLAACGGNTSSEVPTVAFLPTMTDGDLPSVTPTITQTPLPGGATPSATPGEATDVAIATAPNTPTPSQTPTDTATPAATVTPSATITDTPTFTPSNTFTPSATPRVVSGLEALAELAVQSTILPPDFAIDGTPVGGNATDVPVQGTPSSLPSIAEFIASIPGAENILSGVPSPVPAGFSSVANCENQAPGGFGDLESVDATVRGNLGCPLGSPPPANTVASAYQEFENGFMLWVENPGGRGTIYAVRSDGTYSSYPDTWDPSTDPERGGETPPSSDLTEPIRGFGKVWRENASVRDQLGWATGGERGADATFTPYERGVLLYAPQRGDVLAFAEEGAWRGYAGSY